MWSSGGASSAGSFRSAALCLHFLTPELNLDASRFSPDPPRQGALALYTPARGVGCQELQFGTLKTGEALLQWLDPVDSRVH